MPSKPINQNLLKNLLEELGARLASEGRVAEIALYGGSAIMLSFNLRKSTADVDYSPISGSTFHIDRLVKEIAIERNLDPNWMNDSVEIFLSDNPSFTYFGDFPKQGSAGLRVVMASPEYLFAMKCMAMRDSVATPDFRDIWDLADICDITTADQARELVQSFYPKGMPRRNDLLLDDIFNAKETKQDFSPAIGW